MGAMLAPGLPRRRLPNRCAAQLTARRIIPLTKFRRTDCSLGSDGMCVTSGIFWEHTFTFAEGMHSRSGRRPYIFHRISGDRPFALKDRGSTL